jgi:nucleoside-diphosphate-sugar epimerase
VRRVVYAASSSAYGDSPVLPKVETMPRNPQSPYALQKYAGEVYCRLYAQMYGLETVALRYFNIYGPRQDPTSQYAAVIPNFIMACLNGESPSVHEDGEQTRDFTMVADAVRANLLAADAPGASVYVCNVAAGRRASLTELLQNIRELTGANVEAVHGPARAGDVRGSLASLDRESASATSRRWISARACVARSIGLERRIAGADGRVALRRIRQVRSWMRRVLNASELRRRSSLAVLPAKPPAQRSLARNERHRGHA